MPTYRCTRFSPRPTVLTKSSADRLIVPRVAVETTPLTCDPTAPRVKVAFHGPVHADGTAAQLLRDVAALMVEAPACVNLARHPVE
jgi:hypothetical protein